MKNEYFNLVGQKAPGGKMVLIAIVPDDLLGNNLPAIFEVQAIKPAPTVFTGTYPTIKINSETIKNRTEDLNIIFSIHYIPIAMYLGREYNHLKTRIAPHTHPFLLHLSAPFYHISFSSYKHPFTINTLGIAQFFSAKKPAYHHSDKVRPSGLSL